MTEDDRINRGLVCRYCGAETELADSAEIYGRVVRCRRMRICRRCGAYVSCHEGSDDAMGSVANAELRRLRHLAHEWFDPIWQYKLKRSRYNAYSWLSLRLGMNKNHVHMGLFDEEDCRRVIALSRRFIRQYRPELYEQLSSRLAAE